MKVIAPDYYTDFKCTASECADNCCIGWEIDIDEESMELYRGIGGDLGKRLKAGIEFCGTPHFKLGTDERCPFLNKKNLCDIIIALGEENVPYICREHPRFYNCYDEVEEAGLGLCCEEACRMLLGKRSSLVFTTLFDDGMTELSEYSRKISVLRNDIFTILQDKSLDISKRAAAALRIAEVATSSKEFSAKTLLDVYMQLEPLDKRWPEVLQAARDNIDDILHSSACIYQAYPQRCIQYENLLIYFIYRHSGKAFNGGDLGDAVRLAVMSWLVIHILDVYTFDLDGRDNIAEIVTRYSKEIEYSQDNTDVLISLGDIPGFCAGDIAAFVENL